MNKAIILFAIITIVLSARRKGGYIEDSFASNDIRVDKAWNAVEEHYYTLTDGNPEELHLIPIAIYKQLVNGINYKIFFGLVKDGSGEIDLYEYVLYNGPLIEHSDPFHFEVTSTKTLPNTLSIPVQPSKYNQIKELLTKQLLQENNTIENFTIIRANKNVLYSSSIYIVNCHKKYNENTYYYIIFENETDNISIVADWE